jgi:hypothetical protein
VVIDVPDMGQLFLKKSWDARAMKEHGRQAYAARNVVDA